MAKPAAFDLTGPAALDHFQAAAIIGGLSGRSVMYHPVTEEQIVEGARAAGLPEPAIGYMTMLYSVVRAGYAAGVTAASEKVVGRRPSTFREFAQANQAAWK